MLWAPALLLHRIDEVAPAAWALVTVSAAFETAYVIALAAYDAGDLSFVYPIARRTPPVVVAPLAIVRLGERLTPQGLAGIAPVSYVVAGREVSVVVTALLGTLVLGEAHPAARVSAAALVFAGLVAIALAR